MNTITAADWTRCISAARAMPNLLSMQIKKSINQLSADSVARSSCAKSQERVLRSEHDAIPARAESESAEHFTRISYPRPCYVIQCEPVAVYRDYDDARNASLGRPVVSFLRAINEASKAGNAIRVVRLRQAYQSIYK